MKADDRPGKRADLRAEEDGNDKDSGEEKEEGSKHIYFDKEKRG